MIFRALHGMKMRCEAEMIHNLLGEKTGFVGNNRCAVTRRVKRGDRFLRMRDDKGLNGKSGIIELVHARDMSGKSRCFGNATAHGEGLFHEPRNAFANQQSRFQKIPVDKPDFDAALWNDCFEETFPHLPQMETRASLLEKALSVEAGEQRVTLKKFIWPICYPKQKLTKTG
jgi:hypothetical protein